MRAAQNPSTRNGRWVTSERVRAVRSDWPPADPSTVMGADAGTRGPGGAYFFFGIHRDLGGRGRVRGRRRGRGGFFFDPASTGTSVGAVASGGGAALDLSILLLHRGLRVRRRL